LEELGAHRALAVFKLLSLLYHPIAVKLEPIADIEYEIDRVASQTVRVQSPF
jgi:hypothetical protein